MGPTVDARAGRGLRERYRRRPPARLRGSSPGRRGDTAGPRRRPRARPWVLEPIAAHRAVSRCPREPLPGAEPTSSPACPVAAPMRRGRRGHRRWRGPVLPAGVVSSGPEGPVRLGAGPRHRWAVELAAREGLGVDPDRQGSARIAAGTSRWEERTTIRSTTRPVRLPGRRATRDRQVRGQSG